MNRLVVALVSLAAFGALYLGLREDEEAPRAGAQASTDESRREDTLPESLAAETSREPGHGTRVEPSSPVAEQGSVEGALAEEEPALAEEAPAGGEVMPSEASAPLQRYEGADALATRRARQIELVTQARTQARAALARAEEAGDEEIVARTQGILERLQIRLDALETAASSPEPY